MSVFDGLEYDGEDFDVDLQVFCGIEVDGIFKDKLCVLFE